MARAADVASTTSKSAEERLAEMRGLLQNLGVESADVTFTGDGQPIIKSLRVLSPIAAVAQADPTNIQQVAASQLDISNSYYQSVLAQAKRSFIAAIVACAFGLVFFVAAVALILIKSAINAALITTLSGAIVEVIAGLNFWLFGKTAGQLDAFHVRLEQTQRFLLANSVCQNLEGPERNETRSELVKLIANSVVPTDNAVDPKA